MKMNEHARAWGHEFVSALLKTAAIAPEQRSSLHWEILSHLHEAAERRVQARRGLEITLADLQAVIAELGGRDGVAAAFLQNRVVALPRAGFGKRAGSFAIDAAMGLVGIGLVFGVLGELFYAFANPFSSGLDVVLPLSAFAAWFFYLSFTEFRWGATVGKMAFRLKVVMEDGSPLTSRASMIRNVAKVFPPILLVDALLYLIAFRSEDQRASDRIAGTIVVDASKPMWAQPPPAAAAHMPPPPTGAHHPSHAQEPPEFRPGS